MKPLVSIYITTYNRRPLLQRAIDSVLAQTHEEIELIVVDDYSTDDTREYLLEVAANQPQVKVDLKESNTGACVSRNRAIRVARGQFVTGLDDDDFILPNHVTQLLSKHEAVSSRSTLPVAIFPEIAARRGSRLRSLKQPGGAVGLRQLKQRNVVGNQVFAEKECFEIAGSFNEKLPAWQDYDLWIRMALKGVTFFKADGPTYIYEDDPSIIKISAGRHEKILDSYNIVASNPDLALTHIERLRLKINYHRYRQAPMTLDDALEYFRAGLVWLPVETIIKKRVANALHGLSAKRLT